LVELSPTAHARNPRMPPFLTSENASWVAVIWKKSSESMSSFRYRKVCRRGGAGRDGAG
jgi:hypothetical protein